MKLATLAQSGSRYAKEQLILDWLHYDMIEDRYAAIPRAHTETFGWMFQPRTTSSQPGLYGTVK
jgi:hypothetical protein